MQARGVAEVEIVKGATGQFDIIADGAIRFSKRDTARFPTDEEVDALAEG